MKPLRTLLLLTLLAQFSLGQDVGVGIDISRSLGSNPIFVGAEDGIGGYPSVPLATRGDMAPLDATSLAGAFNKYPRQGFLANTVCADGSIAFFYEAHDANGSTGDTGITSILCRKSFDNGETYEAPIVVYRNTSHSTGVNFINTGAACVDRATGRVHLLFTHTTGATAGVAATANGIAVKYLFSNDSCAQWGGTNGTDGTPRDLTTTLKKQSGTTPPYDELNQAWGWNIFGPGAMIQLRNGPYQNRIVCPCNHRYSLDNSDTSWVHCVYTDDNGDNWTLGGGVQETVAGNDNSNEFAIAEYGTDGYIYGQCRIIGTNYRGATRSLDGGATWSNIIVQNGSNLSFDGSTTTTALTSISTQGSVVSNAEGKLYSLFPGDGGARNYGILWESLNGGLTWTDSRYICRRPFGYSGMLFLDNKSLLTVFESSFDRAAASTDGVDWYQYIFQRRLNTDWLATEDTDPDYSYYVFNEKPNGTSVSTVGTQVKDRGNQLAHAKGATGGSFSTSGFTTNGSAANLILQELVTSSTLGHALELGSGSVSITLIGFTTSSNTNTRSILDNRNGSGAGMTYGVTALHKPNMVYSDGTNSASATSSVTVDDGNEYNIRFTKDATNHRATIEVYNVTDGGSVTTTNANESPGNCGYVKGTQNLVLGARANATNPIACTIKGLMFKRTIDTTPLNTVTVGTKQTINEYVGDSYALPAKAPSNLASCKFWAYATYNGCRNAGIDRFGGWDVGKLPYFNGQGVSSYREHTNDYLLNLGGNSANRGTVILSDSTMGKYYRPSFQGGATGYGYSTTGTMGTRLDFVQNTGIFTVCGAIKFGTEQSSNIFDNCNNSSSNPGLTITRSTASQWFVRVSKGGGTNLINDALALNSSLNTWYFFSVTCEGPSGSNKKINVRLVAFPGSQAAPTVPASPTVSSTNDIGSVAGQPFASTQTLAIGARSDGNAGNWDASLKNLCIFDAVLTVPEQQAIAEFCVEN